MPVEIKKTFFVSPVEAFQIVGRESFGPDWKADCVDDPESELYRIAMLNLCAALESGQVSAFWHDFDHERELTTIDAAGEFFRINLGENCIHLSFFAGKPIECRIRSDQLVTFIQAGGKSSIKSTSATEAACFRWLLAMMSGQEETPRRDVLRKMAAQKFPALSSAAYMRARKSAIKKSGRVDLRKPGRPRTKI